MDPFITNETVEAPQTNARVQLLPLTAMDYSGSVEGGYANLELALNYQNKLERPVEPVFTFPLPPEASVEGVLVKIGERSVQAELKPAKQARQDYDQAVDAGHHGALLEQQRENIFTMSVGGIEPGEDVSVSIKYQHPVEWQAGGGRFILPLVVAPHFVHGNPLEVNQGRGFSPDTDKVPNGSLITPLVAGNPDDITYQASVRLNLNPGFSAHIASPSHDMLLASRDLAEHEHMKIELDNLRPDRDLTITYQTTERLPQLKVDKTVWQSAEGVKEEFALIQVVPGMAVTQKPREVVLCLDVSGSMAGQSIMGLREVSKRIIEQLQQAGGDIKIGVVKFDNNAQVIQPLKSVSAEINIDRIMESLQAAGGTSASAGIRESSRLFGSGERDPKIERSIIFVTDGDTTDHDFPERDLRGIRIHGVGLGTAVDHNVLKTVAERTRGSTYWVYPGEDYDTAAREIVARSSGPVVRNLTVEGLERGAEVVGLHDLYASHPLTIAVRSIAELKNLVVRGVGADGQAVTFDVNGLPADSSVNFAQRVWAKMQLREELDEGRLTDLSLRYGVLARTTSFVGVLLKDRPGQKPERVDIPVSLPHGWEMEAGWGMQVGATKGLLRAASAMAFSADIDCVELCACADSFLMDVDDVDVLDGPNSAIDAFASPELLNNLMTLRDEIVQRGSVSAEQKERFRELAGEIEVLDDQAEFLNWDEVDKALLFKTLCELRGFGLKTEIPMHVRERPVESQAFEYWKEAQRSVGLQP